MLDVVVALVTVAAVAYAALYPIVLLARMRRARSKAMAELDDLPVAATPDDWDPDHPNVNRPAMGWGFGEW